MSLLNKASLIQIPSGYKDGTLYSAKPTNGDGDFTFSRGSNLAATRVNSEGLIEKGRENLLLQSNTFDTTWASSSTTETAGQSGYDGSSDAWLLSKSKSGGYLVQLIGTSGVQTFSVYAKAGTTDWMQLLTLGSGTGSNFVFYDLTNGVIGSQGGSGTYGIDSNIESVGGGWYRCSLTFNTTLYDVRVYPADDDNDTSGTSGNIYIQDAQLEQSLVSTPYIETGASTAQAGILEDMPRLDYSGGASCPSLLLEPQRTNLIPQSEYFGASWSASNITITSNATTSPEGVDNATLLANTSALNYLVYGASVSASTTYQFSFYAKNVDATAANVIFYDASNSAVISTTSYVGDLTTEWKRLDFSVTTPVGCTSLSINIVNGLDGSLFVYGAQFEAASYVSSYIPTYGASVTRGADSCTLLSMSNNITSGISSATLLIEYEHTLESSNDAFCFGQNNNFYPAGRGYIYNLGNGFADSFGGGGFSIPQGVNTKTIYRLNTLSNANIFQNGVKGSTVTGTAWSKIDQITFRGAFAKMKIKQITLFNSALTDDECIQLTTL